MGVSPMHLRERMGETPMPRKMSKVLTSLVVFLCCATGAAQERLPTHITPKVQQAVTKGLDWLAKNQGQDGNFPNSADGVQYPASMTGLAGMAFLSTGNTPSRGPYADAIHRAMRFCMSQATSSGLISSTTEFNGRSMYGHGFSLLFLASVYGMETDNKTRE